MSEKPLTILSVTGHVGNGVSRESIRRGIGEFDVDVIAADAGSNDIGPNVYANAEMAEMEYRLRDWQILLEERDAADVPLLAGSVGGVGTREQLRRTKSAVVSMAAEEGLDLTVATIDTHLSKDNLISQLEAEKVSPLHTDNKLTEAKIKESTEIVAQIGHEPFIEALEEGADVVLAGRALDTSAFSAVPIRKGYNLGLAFHLGKALECGALACMPSRVYECLVGELYDDRFVLEPPNPELKCTVESVSVAMNHERTNPYVIHLPSGKTDLLPASYEALDDRAVSVSGATFKEADVQNVLLEGVTRVGYRKILLFGINGPNISEHIDELIMKTTAKIQGLTDADPDQYTINTRLYGKDAVSMFDTPATQHHSDEIGVVIDIVGDTKAIAEDVASNFFHSVIHLDYTDRKNIGGNAAFPFSSSTGDPGVADVGDVYEFSVYHLLETHSSSLATIKTEVL